MKAFAQYIIQSLLEGLEAQCKNCNTTQYVGANDLCYKCDVDEEGNF